MSAIIKIEENKVKINGLNNNDYWTINLENANFMLTKYSGRGPIESIDIITFPNLGDGLFGNIELSVNNNPCFNANVDGIDGNNGYFTVTPKYITLNGSETTANVIVSTYCGENWSAKTSSNNFSFEKNDNGLKITSKTNNKFGYDEIIIENCDGIIEYVFVKQSESQSSTNILTVNPKYISLSDNDVNFKVNVMSMCDGNNEYIINGGEGLSLTGHSGYISGKITASTDTFTSSTFTVSSKNCNKLFETVTVNYTKSSSSIHYICIEECSNETQECCTSIQYDFKSSASLTTSYTIDSSSNWYIYSYDSSRVNCSKSGNKINISLGENREEMTTSRDIILKNREGDIATIKYTIGEGLAVNSGVTFAFSEEDKMVGEINVTTNEDYTFTACIYAFKTDSDGNKTAIKWSNKSSAFKTVNDKGEIIETISGGTDECTTITFSATTSTQKSTFKTYNVRLQEVETFSYIKINVTVERKEEEASENYKIDIYPDSGEYSLTDSYEFDFIVSPTYVFNNTEYSIGDNETMMKTYDNYKGVSASTTFFPSDEITVITSTTNFDNITYTLSINNNVTEISACTTATDFDGNITTEEECSIITFTSTTEEEICVFEASTDTVFEGFEENSLLVPLTSHKNFELIEYDWKVVSGDTNYSNWLDIEIYDENNLRVVFSENTEYQWREVMLEFEQTGSTKCSEEKIQILFQQECDDCECEVISVSVSPSEYTFTSVTETKKFDVTIIDNECFSACTKGFKVYEDNTYITSGKNSFEMTNENGTFKIVAIDDEEKFCNLILKCKCGVNSISVSPTSHTYTTTSETKTFTVTFDDNNCEQCTNAVKVYLDDTYITSGINSFNITNGYGTYTVKSVDDETKTCELKLDCKCIVNGITVTPNNHTYKCIDEVKTFTVTVNDNDCCECTNKFNVYKGTECIISGGVNSFDITNGDGTYTVKSLDNESKTYDINLTKWTPYCEFYIKKIDSNGNALTEYSNSITENYGANDGKEHYLYLQTKSRYYKCETSYDIISYTGSSDSNWIIVNNNNGFAFEIYPNESTESRSGKITLTQISPCSEKVYININQSGKPNEYVFTDSTPSSNLSVSYSANGSSIHVISTKNGTNFDDITVSENCDWVTTLSPSLSGTYYYIPFNLTENTSTSNRSCDVTVTQGESGKDITVTITQEGKVVVEKTDITVKFCGYYTEVMTENAIGRGCDRDGDGIYELFLPLLYVTDYYITYSIEGVTTVPSELQITVDSNRYHLGKESRGYIEYTPISLSGTITVPECDETFNDQICTQIEQDCSPLIWDAKLTDESKYTLTVINRVNQECDESGGGGDDPEPEPAHPVINTLYVQNNLPGSFKLETSLSNQIETVGAGESNQNSIESMVNMGGTITVTVPKASILNGQSVCDSCHIAFATNCTSLDISVASGNFRDDSGDVWWTPDLCFYNQDGSCGWPSATIYSGNYEIKIYVILGN